MRFSLCLLSAATALRLRRVPQGRESAAARARAIRSSWRDRSGIRGGATTDRPESSTLRGTDRSEAAAEAAAAPRGGATEDGIEEDAIEDILSYGGSHQDQMQGLLAAVASQEVQESISDSEAIMAMQSRTGVIYATACAKRTGRAGTETVAAPPRRVECL